MSPRRAEARKNRAHGLSPSREARRELPGPRSAPRAALNRVARGVAHHAAPHREDLALSTWGLSRAPSGELTLRGSGLGPLCTSTETASAAWPRVTSSPGEPRCAFTRTCFAFTKSSFAASSQAIPSSRASGAFIRAWWARPQFRRGARGVALAHLEAAAATYPMPDVPAMLRIARWVPQDRLLALTFRGWKAANGLAARVSQTAPWPRRSNDPSTHGARHLGARVSVPWTAQSSSRGSLESLCWSVLPRAAAPRPRLGLGRQP